MPLIRAICVLSSYLLDTTLVLGEVVIAELEEADEIVAPPVFHVRHVEVELEEAAQLEVDKVG